MDRPSSTSRRPLLRRLRDRLASRDTVHLDKEAAVIVHSPARFQATELPLEDVLRVQAGNRDDGTFDTVVVYFHAEGRPPLAVSEKDSGFAQLIRDLRPHFPGIEDWQTAVPPVAFALTSVDLWRPEAPESLEATAETMTGAAHEGGTDDAADHAA